MNGTFKVAIAVGCLIAANLAFDVGLMDGIYYYNHRAASTRGMAVHSLKTFAIYTLRRAISNILVTQVLLLACWLALGGSRWYWRLALAVPLTVCIAASESIATLLSPPARQRYAEEPWLLFDRIVERFVLHGLWFAAILLTAFALWLPVRRLANWRLTWRLSIDDLGRAQFQAGDLLMWFAPIGGALACAQLLQSFGHELGPNPILLVIEPASVAVVAAMTMVAAFSTNHRRRAVALMIAVTLLVALGFALAERFRLSGILSGTAISPRMAAHLISMFYWQPIEVFLTYVIVMFITLVNCLALRATGCKLTVPTADSAAALRL
jgi:hypothetical protein